MSIIVRCSGCGKRYRVSDKFAGKTGPCPHCKHLIAVPSKTGKVSIHAPEEVSDVSRGDGQLVLRPIAREDMRFRPSVAAAVAGVAAALVLCAWLGGKMGMFKERTLAIWAGLAVVSPVLVLAAYSFLYDDELEPYKGRALYLRATICGLMYAVLWGVFAYVSDIILSGEVWNWFFVAPPFFAAGAMVAATTLDLEYGNGFFHYCFYVSATIVLRWAAGLGWIWDMGRG
jgi:hypothetical protein